MSTENGSTAHKGSYINGINKHVFSMVWRSERDQTKDGLGNMDCLGKGKVYLLIKPDSDLRSESPEVSPSVSHLSACPLSRNLFLIITMKFSWP